MPVRVGASQVRPKTGDAFKAFPFPKPPALSRRRGSLVETSLDASEPPAPETCSATSGATTAKGSTRHEEGGGLLRQVARSSEAGRRGC